MNAYSIFTCLLSKDKSEDKDEESWEEILKHESFG